MQPAGVLTVALRRRHLIVDLVQRGIDCRDGGVAVTLGAGQRRGHLLQTRRYTRQRFFMPRQRGGCPLHFGRLVDRMLDAVAPISLIELLLGLIEVIIGFLDMVTRPVKRIGEVVDRAGVPSLQLIIEFPRITTGRPAQLIDIQIDQASRSHTPALPDVGASRLDRIRLAAVGGGEQLRGLRHFVRYARQCRVMPVQLLLVILVSRAYRRVKLVRLSEITENLRCHSSASEFFGSLACRVAGVAA
nr:hypothetical protein [Mycobacterium kyorinense]